MSIAIFLENNMCYNLLMLNEKVELHQLHLSWSNKLRKTFFTK